ncbi:hypothetical protein PanWU01x14_225640 [Parasponia andersonii]|uniref:Uncharacterized protein n=1 Tax=Parasponia andersonii TaxID=3476 RepID=A0A2P5BMU1_PARAD|nr:hypothetical protein PanWU01x14_225640 [Parasponia andersonii]
MYISQVKVLGALRYFFSIQRETACWYHACKRHTGCVPGRFDCRSNTSKDLRFLSDLCPTNSPNATVTDFNYGMFSDAIQSGILEKTSFAKKLVRCFWWGLRNVRFEHMHLHHTCFK